MDERSVLGTVGEDAAARCLEATGLTVVERNWSTSEGEIDVIARSDGLVVFCEVKTRTSDRWGDPSEAVAHRKRARLKRLAARWMRERNPGGRNPGGIGIRFDVVSVIVRDGRTEVRHIPDAF